MGRLDKYFLNVILSPPFRMIISETGIQTSPLIKVKVVILLTMLFLKLFHDMHILCVLCVSLARSLSLISM